MRMDRQLWNRAVTFHGYECPGLAIGFKAYEAACTKMEIGVSQDEEIVCVTENDTHGVDAVQALRSCTIGKEISCTGKQAFRVVLSGNVPVYFQKRKKIGLYTARSFLLFIKYFHFAS